LPSETFFVTVESNHRTPTAQRGSCATGKPLAAKTQYAGGTRRAAPDSLTKKPPRRRPNLSDTFSSRLRSNPRATRLCSRAEQRVAASLGETPSRDQNAGKEFTRHAPLRAGHSSHVPTRDPSKPHAPNSASNARDALTSSRVSRRTRSAARRRWLP
jgi:hypothetical protein